MRLLAIMCLFVLVFSCKKKGEPDPNNDTFSDAIESPLDTMANGWELIASKKYSDMIANATQYFFKIKHIETHGNVADVFFEKHNAIIGTFNYSRWQVNPNTKKEVSFTNFENFSWDIIDFRSNSLNENDFEYTKFDGYYKGLNSGIPTIPFQNKNYGTVTNKYPVTYSFLGDDATVLSNNYIARVIGEPYDYYVTKNFYYEDQLFTIPYKDKLIHCTFDNNINDNAINVSKSIDTLYRDSNQNSAQDSLHRFEIVKTYKNLLEPSTFVHYGLETKIFKIDQYIHIYLSFRLDPTSSKRVVYHLKLDPESLLVTKESSDFNALYNKIGTPIYLNDRPGHILRHFINNLDEALTLFNGSTSAEIEVPKLKLFATRTNNYFYSKGRIYSLINYKDHLHLIYKQL